MLKGKRHKWKGYIRKTGMIGLMMLLVLPNMLISSVSEVFADEADFDFLVVGETVTIVGYLGTDMDVEIPEQIEGKDVTVIADQAFMMKTLNSVTIPRTVTTIGMGAFMGCELDSIILNEGLEEIGAMAFAGNRMEHVDIPGTVTTIAQGAFSQGNLSTLTLREGLKTIGDQAFWDNEIQAVHIPEGVEVIGEKAFIDNKLEEVKLPGTITSIGEQAFLGEDGKNNIRTLTLHEGLSSIGESAFKDNLLESVHIPGSVSVIEKEAFMGNAIQTLILNEGIGAIGEQAFEQNNIEEVVIPSTVNLISSSAFLRNEINTLTLPVAVGAIGDAAFAFNPLNEVKVYNDELEFGMFPFMQAPPAAPGDITLFGRSGSTTEEYAIANGYTFQVLEESGSTVCGEHTDFECAVNDDDTVTITGYDDYATKDVVIPQLIDGKTVTVIGEGAFAFKGLTSVTIPDSVTDIGEDAFTYNQLTSVILPNSLTSIEEGTFQANQLTSLVIPDFVVNIGQRAFHDNQLTSVTIPNSVVTIGYGAFWVNQLTEITIPDSVEFIGASAFSVNELSSVTIPESVKNIREQSFGRNPLQMVQFEGAVPIFGANPFATPLLDANFEGWYTDENFDNAWDHTVPGPMTIYGKWKEDCGEEECLGMNLTPSETNPTNQDVTISVNVNRLPESIRELKWAKGDQSLAYFQAGGGELVTSNEFIVSENDTYTAYVQDVLGRELIATIQINNIDKTPPVVTGVTDGEVYNAPVIISFNEGTATLNGIAFTSGTTVSANGEYELIVTDEAGNETTVTFEMNQSDYIYVNNGSNTVRITGYRGNDTSIEIPNTLDGQTVAAIGNYAFSEKNLESVVIPDSVTSIGEYAFFENILQEIEIPGSVITIGNHAFRDNNLASVTFSEGLERIGGNAFLNNYITELTIPDTVTLIDYGAFVGNNITELTLGENVQTIEAAAFWFNNLQSVTIPESVRSIGRSAFSNNQIKEFIVLSNQVNINPDVLHDSNPANPEELTIHGYCGSTANELANHWGYSFEQLEVDECLMITLTPSGTEPTNEDVTVLIDVISDIANVVELKWAKGSKDFVDFRDGDGEDVTDNQFTVSENGTYTVYVKDKTGNEKVERIEINNIDKSLLIIHVQIVDGETITLHVYGSDSIQQLKQKIQDAVGIAPKNQKITFAGKVLEDGRTIADYNILNDATVQLVVLSSDGTKAPSPGGGGGVYIPSRDISLDRLEVIVDGKNILPFDPAQFEYDLGDTEAEIVEIIVKTHHPKAKITLDDEAFVDEQTLLLNEGKNIFDIVIIAENGAEQAYTIILNQLEKVPFTDIAGHWAEGYIKKTYWGKMFYGYSDKTFRPDDQISRMEVTSVLVRLLELDEQKQVPFIDVQSIGKDAMKELEKAYTNGMVKGYLDQTFKPYADVTRAHLALIFYRTYEKLNRTPYKPKQLTYFPDIAGYDQETQNAIAMLVELKIAEGSGGKFMPNDQVTRAQAAKMLVNFKEVLGRLEDK
ncbi:leucine-rich repeat protein [Bacillus horti]|uniref:Leucine-rich repeat protein n=1 Tax=Caldalkalibacillus horti TaxID=77523 RepID=A0ABT9VZR1_9BACI|nr:leucine-rich repeat protein [Bacillus horti]MDQ0166473.1 hypothetical protein [Bacillus horti]